ncbi:monocarboxylate transporter 9-like [Littorina saxatilis]|uniref:Uncharacterized protein n=1 Tax=Littorina saxatilis TaxID=31220 RepID=A0AAN9G0X7_9CAEN
MSRTRDKDGGWAWVILFACATCVMLTSGLAVLAGMFQKVFLEEFGGDVVMTSWITSLYASLMQLAGPVTGVVCSVFSCRLSVMVGAVLLTVGLVVSSFCENTTTLLLSFGISSGLGLGLIYSAAIVMVNLSFVHYRPVATGSVLGAGGVGIMVLPALCQYLLDAYSVWETLCILSAVSAQLVIAGALLFPAVDSSRSNNTFCRTHLTCCFKSSREEVKDLPNKEISRKVSSPSLQHSGKSTCETNLRTQDSTENQDGIESDPDTHLHGQYDPMDSANHEKPKDKSSTNTVPADILVRDDTETCEVDHLLYDAGTTLRDKTTEDFHEKNSRCQEKENDNKNRETESVTLLPDSLKRRHSPLKTGRLSDSVKSIHSLSEKPMLSNSLKNLELAFLASSSRSIHSKLASAEELPNTRTCQKLRTVLGSPPLVVICLQLFLANAAVGIVLVHFPEFCLQSGSHFQTVSLSFSMNGLTLTLSRFLMGFLAQDGNVDPLAVYVGLALITSLFIMITPLVALTSTVQISMLACLGIYCGGSYSLLTEITIHCTGVDTLSLAFGMEMISAGLGFLVAPPIAGWLVVLTNSYSNAIFLAGFLSFVAACVAMGISVTRPVWKPVEYPDVIDSYVTTSADDKTTNSSGDKIV